MKQRIEVAAATHDSLYQHIVPFDSVQDEVLARGKSSQTWMKVVSLSAGVRIIAQHQKSTVDGFEKAIGDLETAAFKSNVVGDLIDVSLS